MSNEIDRQLDSVRAKECDKELFSKWMAQYSVYTGFSTQCYVPLDCPYLDLALDFSRRARTAQIGEKCLILQGPDHKLYIANHYDPKTVLIQHVISNLPGGVKLRKPSWRERRLIHDAYDKLIHDGRPARHVHVRSDENDSDSWIVSAGWIIADDDHVYSSNTFQTWGSREDFARACAQTLLREA